MLKNKLIFSVFLVLVSYSVFGFFKPVNYDLNHNIQTEQRFTGEIIHYNYDERDRLTGIQSNETGFTQLNYYPDNKLHSINYANGVIAALSYDNKGQLLELQHSADGENLYQVSYEYDSHGNRTKRFDQWGNEHRMQMFMYNAEDWLLKYSTLNDQHIYYYTPTGNRESYKLVQGDNNDVIAHQQYHYNQRDQLVQIEDLLNPANNIDYTYDENGNQLTKTQNGVVSENQYDGRNRIHSHQANNLTTTYHYDHLGRRITVENPNKSLRYHYNLSDQLVIETNQLNDVIRSYNYGNNFQLAGKDGDNIYYYHNDDLNSPNVITAPDKSLVGTYQYLPFGNKTVLEGLENHPIGFTGYYLDNESDQYYAQQRYYNQYTGQFNREDPVEGSFEMPLSLNRYVYANNNPLIYIDPNGEKSLSTTLRDAELDCQSGMCAFGYRFLSNVYTVGTLGFASIHDPAKDDYDAGKISGYDYAASLAGGLGATAFSIATLGTGSGLIAGATTTAGKIGTSAFVGGSVTGAQNTVKQGVELAASRQDSFDTGELLIETGVGTAFGAGTAASVQALRAAKNVFKVKSVIIDEGGKSLEPVITQVNGNKSVGVERASNWTPPSHKPQSSSYKQRIYRYEVNDPDRLKNTWTVHKWNIASNHRYTGPGSSGVYGGTTEAAARIEISYYDDLSDRILVSQRIQRNNLLDLRKNKIRRQLNVKRGDLINKSHNYRLTHDIGKWARQQGYSGILAPSARDKGGANIVLFDGL